MSALRRPVGRATSGWNSSATGCSASPSPNCSSGRSPARRRASSPGVWRTRARESCAEIATRLGCRPLSQARRRRGACGRAAQPDHPGGCLRSDHRRGLHRWRLRGRQGLVERAFQALLEAPRRPLRDPKSALQEWAQGRACRRRPTPWSSRPGPIMRPKFRVMVKVKGAESEFGLGHIEAHRGTGGGAKPSLERGRAGRRKSMEQPEQTDTKAGFVALIGAPECGQVDAAQLARRLQGLDRLAQGADDARAGARHRHRGRGADHVRRHARHLQAASAASTGPW